MEKQIQLHRVFPELAHIFLNYGATYDIRKRQWFIPESLLECFKTLDESLNSFGHGYPPVLKQSCPTCGCDTARWDCFKPQHTLYVCKSEDCDGQLTFDNVNYIFTTRVKHSLTFVDSSSRAFLSVPKCGSCRGSFQRTYFGNKHWLVCQNSLSCSTYFVESTSNIITYENLPDYSFDNDDYRLIRNFWSAVPEIKTWPELNDSALEECQKAFIREFCDMESSLFLVNIDYEDTKEVWFREFEPFLMHVLYFTNFNVPAALRFFRGEMTYARYQRTIGEVSNSKSGLRYIASHLKQTCEDINQYRRDNSYTPWPIAKSLLNL